MSGRWHTSPEPLGVRLFELLERFALRVRRDDLVAVDQRDARAEIDRLRALRDLFLARERPLGVGERFAHVAAALVDERVRRERLSREALDEREERLRVAGLPVMLREIRTDVRVVEQMPVALHEE